MSDFNDDLDDLFDSLDPKRAFVVCRLCSLPCAVRCSECQAILDGTATSCPGCGVAFCETAEECEAGEPHRMGIDVCRIHGLSESEN
jgi:hypothetical protein